MDQRIKGQDTQISVITDGQPELSITTISKFSITLGMDESSEGYLGETTERKDATFTGVKGDFDMHTSGPEVFTFIQKIIDKARRLNSNTKFNIKTKLLYPNGRSVLVMIPDVVWGEVPIEFGSRTDFVQVSLSFNASLMTTLLS